MRVGIITATILLSFYLFQYLSERGKAEKEADELFQKAMNSDQKEDEDLKSSR